METDTLDIILEKILHGFVTLIKFTLSKVWLMIVNRRRICLNWIISLYVDIVSIKNPRGFLTFFSDTGRKVYISTYMLLSPHLIFNILKELLSF